MEKSKCLYIHIGSHKTGTTSIQRSLVEHKDYLKKNGMSLFHEKPNGQLRHIGNVHPWVALNLDAYCTDGAKPTAVKQGLKAGFCERISQLPGDVVVSCESFSYFFDKDSLNKFIIELNGKFDDIKVLVYLRRQDAHAVSHHQQGSKDFKTGAAKLFGSTPRALPKYSERLDLYLDYHQRLTMWSDIVGDENMFIRVFDKKFLKNADVVDDFFELLGLEKQYSLKPVNESLGFIRTKVGHLINTLRIPLSRVQHLRQALDNSSKLLPSREEALQFYQHYKNNNQLLNQRFKINKNEYLFSDDFTMYPEQTGDCWDEDSANKAITNILYGLNKVPTLSFSDVDFLKSCLILLKESGEHKLAKRLEVFIEKMESLPITQIKTGATHKRLLKKLKQAVKPYYTKLRHGLLTR